MVKQIINIGTIANDGTGDPLRTAFTKANENFTEVYDSITSVTESIVSVANSIPSLLSEFENDEGFISASTGYIILNSRYELGDPVSFSNAGDFSLEDSIGASLTLKRDAGGGAIYNSSLEANYDQTNRGSPAGTLWNADGFDNLDTIKNRYYTNFSQALNHAVGRNILSAELVMHDTINNKYYKFDFSAWGAGAANATFAYTRTEIIINDIGITFPDSTVQSTAWTGVLAKHNLVYVSTFSGHELAADHCGSVIYSFNTHVTLQGNSENDCPIGSFYILVVGDTASLLRVKQYGNTALNPTIETSLESVTDAFNNEDYVLNANSISHLIKIESNKWALVSAAAPIVSTPNTDIILSGVQVIGGGTGSGDELGNGTLELVPDANLYENDQYLVVDPTTPGHIHLRAGGIQDASNAFLFLGGEDTNILIRDTNNSISVNTKSESNTAYAWTFGNDGSITLPIEGKIINDGKELIFDIEGNLIAPRAVVAGNSLEGPDGFSGFSFATDGGYDTGMFSISDGKLEFWVQNQKVIGIDGNGGISVDIIAATNVNIQTYNSDANTSYTWGFNDSGTLTFPTGVIGDVFAENMIGIQADPSNANSYASIVSHDKQNALDANKDVVRILTDDANQGGSSTKEWSFDRNGNLTFPDGEVQTTAYPGPPTGFFNTGENGDTGAFVLPGGNIVFQVDGVAPVAVINSEGIDVNTITTGASAGGNDLTIITNDGGNINIDGETTGIVSLASQSGGLSIGRVGGSTDVYGEVEFNNGTTAFQSGNSVSFNGSVNFTNATVTGLSGDTGNVTFDDNTIQGNTLGTVGTQITVNTNYLGVTTQNSNVFNLTKTADTNQVQIGWIIRGSGGGPQTITNKVDGGSYWSFYVASGISTTYPITIESSDYQLGGGAQLILAVDPGDSSVKSWTFDSDGTLTAPGDITLDGVVKHSTQELTGGADSGTATALDLTKSVQVLVSADTDDDSWSLADGVEGQIMYFVPKGAGLNNHYINITNVRYWSESGYTVGSRSWIPFKIDDNLQAEDYRSLATAIFTDGAWNTDTSWFD